MIAIHRSTLIGIVSILFLGHPVLSSSATASSSPETIIANDNTRAAGTSSPGTLTLSLRAARGMWQPEGPGGPAVDVEAFGEISSALMVPAPLIRVRAGTSIAVSIRNDLTAALRVQGLCARNNSTCATVEVPPSDTRDVRFTIDRPGTYHYWATTMGAPVPFRELVGALVVDPAEGKIEPDRVMVISEWTSLTPHQLGQVAGADDPGETFVALRPRFVFTINGLSWPATERLTYRVGDTVRWRVINLSSQAHPMHLHGFYFYVDRLGNGLVDAPVGPELPHRVVTQLLPSGGTMSMTWVPEREGNWLLHCHVMHHVSPTRRFGEEAAPAGAAGSAPSHAEHTGNGGMAGMVVGLTVLGRAENSPPEPKPFERSPRKLTLVIGRELILNEGDQPSTSGAENAPAPPIVLRRDEPVEITLVNRLREPTAVHWHGIELESFYDGVHGWSGSHARPSPMVEPGGSFIVRFTPPRTGTFIYHTHVHDLWQLSSGLYGPLIVMEPGETFDPAKDHALVLSRNGLTSEWESIGGASASTTVLNGHRTPRFVWSAGTSHRLRVINITPDDIFSVCLQSAEGTLVWKPLTKDGAPLDPAAMKTTTACQKIAVGETYDFEYQAPVGRRTIWLEVRTTAGKWQLQGQVTIK